MALVIPDIIILDTVNKCLQILRDDYNSNIANGTEDRSLLYILFNALTLGRYDFYENIKSLIITTPENPRHIFATESYDQNVNKTPHIYVTLPSESTKNNSMGIGEGDYDEIVYDNPSPEQDQYRKQYNRRYFCTYLVVIIAENRNESLVLYHLIKNMMVTCTNHFHMEGIQNLTIGGQDLKMDTSTIDRIFKKGITLNFEYEQQVPDIFIKGIYNKLLLYWKPEGAITRQGPITITSDDSDADSF